MKVLFKVALLAAGIGLSVAAQAQVAGSAERGSVSPTGLITTGAAIDTDGNVVVWGFRGSGQQGDGSMSVTSSKPPARVPTLSNINHLATGAYHLLALDSRGNVYGWGQSGYGETGCPGAYVKTPCQVLTGVSQIAAGEYFSMALKFNGEVYTWGHNLYGQLGDGGSKNSNTPVLVNLNGERARLIGGAYEGGFAVTREGHVWAWGDNEASGLGFQGPNYGVQRIIRQPTRVPNLEPYAADIKYIAGGNGWGEALLYDGRVIGWGLRAGIGVGTTATSISSPEPVEIMRNVKQLFARYVGSFALTHDDHLFTWGQTGGSAFPMVYGAAPHLRFQLRGKPIAVGGGKEHLFYQTEDGKIWGIGYNDLHKLDMSKCCAPNIDWPGTQIVF
ncbi:MAG: hypothetical protein LBV45_04335 [Xanthomonadaceae bacterium]|jgi:alpha-tubulin suppressor-like RCC1 family protein|nr:hypothetical protein [Xanthomonadaceae bacterium]